MFIALVLKHALAPSERNAQRTFRPYGAWASWTDDDYKHCAPDGAYLRHGQAARSLIQCQWGRGKEEREFHVNCSDRVNFSKTFPLKQNQLQAGRLAQTAHAKP